MNSHSSAASAMRARRTKVCTPIAVFIVAPSVLRCGSGDWRSRGRLPIRSRDPATAPTRLRMRFQFVGDVALLADGPKAPSCVSSRRWQAMQVLPTSAAALPVGAGCVWQVSQATLRVRAIERVLGAPRMVVVPEAPGARVVAALAGHAELQLVLVVLLVAAEAVARRVLVARRHMAVGALHGHMLADQREARLAVVEVADLPVAVAVAALALRACWPSCLSSFLWQACSPSACRGSASGRCGRPCTAPSWRRARCAA